MDCHYGTHCICPDVQILRHESTSTDYLGRLYVPLLLKIGHDSDTYGMHRNMAYFLLFQNFGVVLTLSFLVFLPIFRYLYLSLNHNLSLSLLLTTRRQEITLGQRHSSPHSCLQAVGQAILVIKTHSSSKKAKT